MLEDLRYPQALPLMAFRVSVEYDSKTEPSGAGTLKHSICIGMESLGYGAMFWSTTFYSFFWMANESPFCPS